MKYLIGIDIGTQGTKTTVFRLDGTAVADSFESSNLICPSPGIVMQKPDEVFASVTNTIQAAMQKAGAGKNEVAAIAFDGQMAGIMGVDSHYEAVTYYDSWLDTRCEKYIRQIRDTCGKKVVETTGCPVTYAHGPKILWWKHEQPETYKRVSKFVMLHSYVAGKLCGLTADEAFIDFTNIHFTGFADNQNKSWSQDLLDIFDVSADKMPMIVEPWKQVGRVRKDYADLMGVAEGTPVMAGCGDSAATSLGAGIVRAGQAFDVAGTASIFSCCVDRYAPDTKYEALLQMRSVIDGLWQPLAYINGGGLCLRWFKDKIAMTDYAVLEEEAKNLAPGSDGIIFNPHFDGRVCPNNPNIKGNFLGLNWLHTRGHMYRSIMEGIAFEYRFYLNVLRDLGLSGELESVYAMGGGVKSRLFNQIKSDVLGLRYTALKNQDTAALGCALIAGYGAGIYKDIAKTAERFVEKGGEYTPDKTRYGEYEKYSKLYNEQFKALEDIYRKLKN